MGVGVGVGLGVGVGVGVGLVAEGTVTRIEASPVDPPTVSLIRTVTVYSPGEAKLCRSPKDFPSKVSVSAQMPSP